MSESIHAHETRLNIAAQKAVGLARLNIRGCGPYEDIIDFWSEFNMQTEFLRASFENGNIDSVKDRALHVAALALRLAAWNDTPKA